MIVHSDDVNIGHLLNISNIISKEKVMKEKIRPSSYFVASWS